MGIQKLVLRAAVGCVLLGVSGGAAMAEGCGDGVLEDETFDGSLVVTDESSCSIISSTIEGDLRIRDTDNILLLNNKVGGRVMIRDGGVANAIANTVFGGPLVVRDNDTANVIENETLTDDIRVVRNIKALVQKNIAARNLICRENTDLSSSLNFAGRTLNCE